MWKSGPAETEIFRHCRHIFHLRFKACVRLACMAKQWHTLESQSGERKCFFRKGGEMMSFVVSTDGCKTFLWAIVSNCIYFNDLFIIFCQWIDEHLLLERVLWMVCKPCKYCIWAWDSSTADFTVKASEEQIMYRVGNNPCLHSFALFNDERGKEKFVGVRVCVFTFWMQRSLWYFCILPVVLWYFLNYHTDRLKVSQREMLICVWGCSHMMHLCIIC